MHGYLLHLMPSAHQNNMHHDVGRQFDYKQVWWSNATLCIYWGNWEVSPAKSDIFSLRPRRFYTQQRGWAIFAKSLQECRNNSRTCSRAYCMRWYWYATWGRRQNLSRNTICNDGYSCIILKITYVMIPGDRDYNCTLILKIQWSWKLLEVYENF